MTAGTGSTESAPVPTRLRVVFMGTPPFAVPSFDALRMRGEELVAVVTQPDRPRGRGHAVTPSAIKVAALAAGVPVLQPEKVRHPDFLESCRALAPDLIVVVAFGQILPKALLDIPRYGCINVHASLLPRYRGAAPIQWAIIRGETETGVTTMLMDPGMDTGPILLQRRIPIVAEDTAQTLSERLAVVGAEALDETLDALKAGRLHPQPQDSAHATLAPLLKKEDGRIDWGQPAAALAALVRGANPWPGAYTTSQGEPFRIWAAHAEPGSGEPGVVLCADGRGVVVGTGEGLLVITEVQMPGGKRLSAREAAAGHLVTPGLRVV
jgi:methionyl-tRNA formyltransferase